MACCPDDVPWWRVVHADGSMKGTAGADEQRARLAEEGVPSPRRPGRLAPSRRPLVTWAAWPPAGSLTPRPVGKRPVAGWAVVGLPVAVLRHSRPLPLISDAVSSENPW
jgi:hypothetical protein